MGQARRSKRTERLQIMLLEQEIDAIDRWRYENMIPTRAAAIRELLRRGLVSNELGEPVHNAETAAYRVLDESAN